MIYAILSQSLRKDRDFVRRMIKLKKEEKDLRLAAGKAFLLFEEVQPLAIVDPSFQNDKEIV